VPRIAGCPYIFSTNGQTPINGFSKLKQRLDAAIGQLKASGEYERQFNEPWTFHDLRRTFSTGLIELGVSESVVDLLTNHRSGEAHRGVRRHYNHARREREKREAMLLWEKHIRSLVQSSQHATPPYLLAA
jgi:integrase